MIQIGEYTIINQMADGSICDDLSTYIDDDHPLPEDAQKIILNMMRVGHKLNNGG